MKKYTIILAILASCSVWAQNTQPSAKDGGISEEMMQRLRSSYKPTSADKAIRNALAQSSIATLALSSENAAMIDTHFSDVVKTRGITNQKSSGRCWLFTGLNVLRAQAIEQFELPELVLSQGYVFFYDLLEKSNLFLQSIIDTRSKKIEDREVEWLLQNPISDGGTFTGVADLVSKYGCVPASAYPETAIANSTAQLRSLLSLRLREDALILRGASPREIPAMKEEMLCRIYRMLALSLGEPPVKFTWTRCNLKGEIVSTKEYTPKEFYAEYFGNDLRNNYVMLMNDPRREYYKTYEMSYCRHVYDGQNWVYLNLPVEEIKQIAISSIKGGKAMYFGCDVAKYLDRTKGTLDLANYDYDAVFGIPFEMDKKERVTSRASGSSHAMSLIAVDINAEGKSTKWMVENSWGESSGYKGKLIMTDEWFDNYMFRLVAEKQFIPENLLRIVSDSKPVLLPAWDPMFAQEQ